jgi:hypothetical protein
MCIKLKLPEIDLKNLISGTILEMLTVCYRRLLFNNFVLKYSLEKISLYIIYRTPGLQDLWADGYIPAKARYFSRPCLPFAEG